MDSINFTFYSNSVSDSEVILHDQEASHASQVLRKKVGDHIHVIDGLGGLYSCQISSIQKKEINCSIFHSSFYENSERLILAIAPPKNRDRLEWMIEKLVEIGVKQIILLETKNTVRTKTNLTRIEKKVLSAVKQSLRYHIPEVKEMDFKETLALEASYKWIAHCEDGEKSKQMDSGTKDQLVLIGPEGDFTLEEIELAKSAGFQPLDLGEFRLRTETAAIVAASRVRI